MRIRKCVALGGAVLIFLGCLIIYRMADYTLYPQEDTGHRFQSKPLPLEEHIVYNPKINPVGGNNVVSNNKIIPQITEHKNQCKRLKNDVSGKIQMSEVYKELKFDNVDGGAWKQGWNIETDPHKWNSQKKLKVFIVPHSHNDPGWLKTFEDYYTSETRNILSNMLKKLTTDSNKKFIWAEISFFSLWWDELSEGDQEKVKRLVEEGQLEIVTGGWVMNDEANTHYYSMITQLTEGHQWIKTNFKVHPKNGWTIDPFGESSVMPYLLKKMGLEGLVIQRVHYSIKKYFAQTKNLEFQWRQSWDEKGSTDLLTHMTPFYSYDVPHTCGPDPKICCQFDFKRLPGNGLSCPWKIPPKVITKKNVAVRAQMLLDQYRKKSELYRTNVVLVPLGDDFRYQYPAEWDNQFENYYKILSYINTNPDLYTEVKFGTLSDFFNALKEELAVAEFPTLVGDFFTYADRDDHYWSGYYTSRPFYKRMDRILIGYHRAAEILFALGWGGKKITNANWLLKPQNGFAKMLRDARRSLSLFQHHDGITGTARDNVMEDYARKMLEAINYSQHIIQQVTHFLLSPNHLYHLDAEQTYFEFDDQRKYSNASPQRKVLILAEGESKTITFFNSLTYKRFGIATIEVFTANIEVLDSKGNSVACQISPIFLQDSVMDDSRFEISFIVEVPALGLTSYKIIMKTADQLATKNSFSKIKVINGVGPVKHAKGFENVETADGREFSIENHCVLLSLSENGLLKSVTNKNTKDFVPLHLDFVRYLARPGKESSGAYLFLPEGEASIIRVEFPLIRIYSGSLFTRVEVKFPNVKHFLQIYNSHELENLGIEIVNVVNILNDDNYELAMRLTSHVKNGDEFYTDLNGFQIVKRKTFAKLPIQGNFYPMPTASFIEDEATRLTILSAQPLGVSSLKEGQLEVLQDRRLKQDDNRGLGQGVLDNKITPNLFRILVEKRLENCQDFPSLSRNAYLSSQSLLYPIVKMIWKQETQNDLRESYSPVANDLNADLHLVSVRTFDEEEIKPSVGLVFHRPNLDSCFEGSSSSPGNGTININSFLPNHFGDKVRKASLSFLSEESKLNRKEDHSLCYMDFLALVLS